MTDVDYLNEVGITYTTVCKYAILPDLTYVMGNWHLSKTKISVHYYILWFCAHSTLSKDLWAEDMMQTAVSVVG